VARVVSGRDKALPLTTKSTQSPFASRLEHVQTEYSLTSLRRRRLRRIDRFLVTYLRREIRSRFRQALLIALGIGFSIGLVLTVTAVSAGVGNAQKAVLRSLYGIGTDLIVTGRAATAPSGPVAQSQNSLTPLDLELLPSTWIDSVRHLAHVTSVASVLELSEVVRSGGIPQVILVDGVDVIHRNLGSLVAGTITSGHNFSVTDATSSVAILDANYASANKITVGSTITLADTNFAVVGIVNQTQGSGHSDIYVPLRRAQTLAQSSTGKNLTGLVNVIYVAAASSTDITSLQTEINRKLPNATVTGTSDLASQVSGSLTSAAALTNDLGRWVALAALIAALGGAGLLATAAVNRRIREIGTLKALGWSSERIVIQIMSESVVVGIIGAAIGVGIGFSGADLVKAIAPKLSAIVPQGVGSEESTTVLVRLTTSVSVLTIIVAVLIAFGGALLAGSVAALRAAKLQPVDAFAQVD
jgi:putative ABC transport system permease protein